MFNNFTSFFLACLNASYSEVFIVALGLICVIAIINLFYRILRL